MTLKSINPYTNSIISETEELSEPELNGCIYKAEQAFRHWKQITVQHRKSILLNASQILSEKLEEMAELITQEMGKSYKEALAEVSKSAKVCKFYANNGSEMLEQKTVTSDAHQSYVSYEPLGTILGVMPWNFPFWQVFRFAAPTLMSGNTILLKHASNVQMCAKAIEQVLKEAGLPEGVFQNMPVDSSQVKDIIKHPAIKAVSLTGSEFAGRQVAKEAGNALKKSVVELGGSNAFIVLKDACIERAVDIGVKARMQNAGQSCIAAKRFIVHEDVIEEFTDKYLKKIQELKTVDPFEEGTDIGPLASKKQADTVHRQVKESEQAGAEILNGGVPKGATYPPTLVTNVKPGMPLFDEEVFGPVASIISCKDTSEAIELTNLSDYGLGVSLFSDNLEEEEKLVPYFEDGAVFINAMVKSDPRLPFGRTKNSGYGRELSVDGIREFVNVKTVYIDHYLNGEYGGEEEDGTVMSTGQTASF